METDTGWRIVALCVLLAGAETLHGIARTTLLVPRLGKDRALRLSALTGTLLAFGLCAWRVPDLGLATAAEHLALGLVLAGFMAAFDIAIGRWLMRKRWSKIWPDFNPATGNWLLFGLLALCLMPWFVWWLRIH